MDELDRVYRRLVQNLRAAFPELLTRPFEVAKIYQQILPYRTNRRELAFETSEDYELTLTRLLSGARGLLMGDDEMQKALRAELESPNPDLSAYRAFATSMVTLAPEALRALDAQPAMRPTPSAGDAAPNSRSAADQARLAARATEEVGTRRAGDAPPPATSGGSPPLGARTRPVRPPASAPAISASAGSGGPSCQYCAGELPEGKTVVFCPHCGQDLTVKHCPACNTELEVGWKFCITCGRGVE